MDEKSKKGEGHEDLKNFSGRAGMVLMGYQKVNPIPVKAWVADHLQPNSPF